MEQHGSLGYMVVIREPQELPDISGQQWGSKEEMDKEWHHTTGWYYYL